MPRPASSSLSKWARWALLASTLAMAAALLSTAWSSRRRANEASELLLVGQGQSLVRMLGEHVRYSVDPNDADLASFVADNAELGVRFVEVRMHDGTIRRAGTTLGSAHEDIRDWRGPAHRMLRIGKRVKMIGRVPPRPPRTGEARPFGRRADRHRGGPRLGYVVLEFEPVVGNRLRDDAERGFVLSSAVAGAFLLVTAALWALLRQRERAEARAEQDRRLALLGEMSAVLAHEIRNPLASLKGHAQLLAEQLDAGSAQRRKADRVVSEAQRIESLSSSLLDFVRSGSIKRERVNPAELVRKSAEAIAARVELDATHAPPSFSLDPLRMQQVFTNLLDNAAQVSAPEHPIRVQIGTDRDRLLVTVRDSGPGIGAGQEQRIFEAFYTTRTRGVGLGLAVALRIVELHGGTITATNHPDGGAVFEISIPPES
jgi:two-component system sensor histidine kinase HydH